MGCVRRIVVVAPEPDSDFLCGTLGGVGRRAPDPGIVTFGAEVVDAATEEDGPLVFGDELVAVVHAPTLEVNVLAAARVNGDRMSMISRVARREAAPPQFT